MLHLFLSTIEEIDKILWNVPNMMFEPEIVYIA